jgi:kynurenine formamidase
MYKGKIIDLTANMYEGVMTMPMDPKFGISWHCTLDTLGYNLSRVTMSTHQGTHMDCERHFHREGAETIDQVGLDRLIVRAVKVELTHLRPNTQIHPDDLKPYEKFIDAGCAVLLHTGWDKKFSTPEYFKDFPGVSKPLADYFIAKKTPIVGIDSPTPNPQAEEAIYFHVEYLKTHNFIVEGLANMDALPNDTEFTFYTMPLKFQGRDGSPVRAFAMLD